MTHGLIALASLLLMVLAAPVSAQECPNARAAPSEAASKAQTLEGQLVYHDGIRQWYELKLDRRRCGQRSIQLTRPDDRWKTFEVLRDCRVSATGPIDFSPTGYYSLDLYQGVTQVAPVGSCARKRPLPDYSNAKPSPGVRSYTVYMHVDYRRGDHPITFHARSAGRELRPWQAYADYTLTGGFVLYGNCGKGFVVDTEFGTRAALLPREGDEMAAFDPETPAASGNTDLHLGYSCVRDEQQKP